MATFCMQVEDMVSKGKIPSLSSLRLVQSMEGDPREVILVDLSTDSALCTISAHAADATAEVASKGNAARLEVRAQLHMLLGKMKLACR